MEVYAKRWYNFLVVLMVAFILLSSERRTPGMKNNSQKTKTSKAMQFLKDLAIAFAQFALGLKALVEAGLWPF